MHNITLKDISKTTGCSMEHIKKLNPEVNEYNPQSNVDLGRGFFYNVFDSEVSFSGDVESTVPASEVYATITGDKPVCKAQSLKEKVAQNVSRQKETKVGSHAAALKCDKCDAPWMEIAKAELAKCIQRYYGKKNGICSNPEIVKYHLSAGIPKINSDEKDCTLKQSKRYENISWCGSFISWTLKNTNDKDINKDLTHVYAKSRAIHWALFGKQVQNPIYGAIAVKTRGKGGVHVLKSLPSKIEKIKNLEKLGKVKKARSMAIGKYTGSGHVGFVMGVDRWPNPQYIYILGGNQWGYSNTISWGKKITKDGKSYIKSVLFPSKYKFSDWNIGFFVPSQFNSDACKPKIYTGDYINSLGDGA